MSDDKENIITIEIPKKVDSDHILNQSQLIDESFFIKLETKKECLLGMISQLRIMNNRIFILDSHKSKGLFEFDLAGNFVRKIGHEGNGPGEYLMPISFDLEGNKILIFDAAKRNLLFYDSEGRYLKAKKINNRNVTSLSVCQSNIYIDAHKKFTPKPRKETFSILKANLNGEITGKFLDMSKSNIGATSFYSNHSFFKKDSIVFYNPTTSNKIFKIDSGNIQESIVFSFENRTPPLKAFEEVLFNKFLEEIEINNYSYFDNDGGYSFLKDFFFFHIKTGSTFREPYVYNLKTKKLFKIEDKHPTDFGFYVKNLCTYKDQYIVNYAFPVWYLKDEKFTEDKVKGTHLEELIKSSKIEDNPVLIFNHIRSDFKLNKH